MRISDPITNDVDLGFESSRDTVGIVFKTSEMLGGRPVLGLIIPKFMLGYEFKDGDQPLDVEYKIPENKSLNEGDDIFWDSSAMVKNYILARPLLNQNQTMPVYNQGDKVFVTMIDDDIKTLSFLPYSINRLGQRGTDMFIMTVPGSPNDNTELTEDNCYVMKMDSRTGNQKILIQTSDANGEVCKHTLELDSGNGLLRISDNQDLLIEMDTQNDKIIIKTSGSTTEMSGDKITHTCDTYEVNAESKIIMKTDKIEIEATEIESQADDVKYNYEKFAQESASGDYKIDNESHDGMSFGAKGNTFHADMPLVGLNGTVALPTFTIGAVPDINNMPTPTAGTSGPNGSMTLQTDPSGVPLAKFPELMACLAQIGAAADAYPSGGGMGSAAVASFAASGATKKILSS